MQYVHPGAAITFQDSGGSVTWTTNGIATTAGRISARADLTNPHSPWYTLTCTFRMNVAGTVGQRVEYYLAWSNGTHPDAELGTADAAITNTNAPNNILNMKPALTVIVDKTTANTDITGSALVNIPTQYVQVVLINQMTIQMQVSPNVNICSLTPAPLEQQ